MELGKAIVAASRFVPKGEAIGILGCLHFFNNVHGSWVHATDGSVGCAIRLNSEVPSMVVAADVVSRLARFPTSGVGANSSVVEFLYSEGGRYTFDKPDAEQFPPLPPRGRDTKRVDDWCDVLRVSKAALKMGGSLDGVRRQDLECVHFMADRVEATDTYRILIGDVEVGISGKVPARTFQHWPTGEVYVHATDTHAWFDVGDVGRYATFQKGKYASGVDLRKYVSETEHGGLAIGSAEFLAAVKKATRVAKAAGIMLEFRQNTLTVKGVSDSGGFETSIASDLGEPWSIDSLMMDGKMLESYLSGVDTPRVRVQNFVDGSKRWIRLESGLVVGNLYGRT